MQFLRPVFCCPARGRDGIWVAVVCPPTPVLHFAGGMRREDASHPHFWVSRAHRSSCRGRGHQGTRARAHSHAPTHVQAQELVSLGLCGFQCIAATFSLPLQRYLPFPQSCPRPGCAPPPERWMKRRLSLTASACEGAAEAVREGGARDWRLFSSHHITMTHNAPPT